MNIFIALLVGFLAGGIFLKKKSTSDTSDPLILDQLQISDTSYKYDLLVATVCGLLQYHFKDLHKQYGSKMSGDLFTYKVALNWYGKGEYTDSNLDVFKSVLIMGLTVDEKSRLKNCVKLALK